VFSRVPQGWHSRRTFLKASAVAGAAVGLGALAPATALAQTVPPLVSEIRYYHEISGPVFRRQLLNLLDSGAQPISLETIVGALNGTITVPRNLRTFHIAWDDARLSQITEGWPVIQGVQQSRGIAIPVTAFVMTQFAHLALPVDAIPDDTPCYVEMPPGGHRFFTKKQALDLVSHGVQLANHTVDHPVLPHLPIPDRNAEIASGEQRVQALWDLAGKTRSVKVFAYPYGAFDVSTLGFIQSLGYDAAFSTLHRTIHSPADRYQLGRIGYS